MLSPPSEIHVDPFGFTKRTGNLGCVRLAGRHDARAPGGIDHHGRLRQSVLCE